MSVLTVVLKRISMGIVTAWAVLTAVFALFMFTRDWMLARTGAGLIRAGADEEEVEAARENYLASRGLDRPLHENYLDWMGNLVTLDWGESFVTEESVLPLVIGRTARTTAYVVPGIALGFAIAFLVGLYVAMNPDSRSATSSRTTTYLLFALPNFWIGGVLLSFALEDMMPHSAILFEHVLPIVLTATVLVGGYVSYVRAHAMEYVDSEFVKLVTAKGASPARVARHVVRNAAIPITSTLFTEALGLLVLSIFVIEKLFGIDGFGLMFWDALNARDLPVIMGATLVVILFGVLGNVIQDLSYQYLDPRVGADTT